ncbi:MAG TPA: sigma-54-dependent Fis family transcriptional regulator [Terracidiphilus sp.]|nr:sigma-54-dependent Fis family transcriptional regulator [Terracidiphilus sp.]
MASADRSFRQRLNEILTGLRWQVREAAGGAEAWTETELVMPEAFIVDSWLPDLDHTEFLRSFRVTFPEVDLLVANGISSHDGPRCPHRQELLYALRRSQDGDGTPIPIPIPWSAAGPLQLYSGGGRRVTEQALEPAAARDELRVAVPLPAMPPIPQIPFPLQPPRKPILSAEPAENAAPHPVTALPAPAPTAAARAERLPELIGEAALMLEVSRRIRLVAPRLTPVLIEGPTGSGKELVAEALHRLSPRSRKAFIAINCAAIPEALLEAELFGHTRGAFTGAVQGRTGRIEAANGGTLFLDEIGEMPQSLQAKLLRFVECGELQRVGENETVKVDVRIVAATHRPLAEHAQSGAFRSDLYYRLAVFLIRTPALAEHIEDLPLLVEHFLTCMARQMPRKQLDATAMNKLRAHRWPGNVRELEHVLERAAILSGDAPVLTAQEIDFGVAVN